MIRLALLSYWHVHAKDYFKDAAEHPDTEVVAIWDELPERGKEKAQELGLEFVENLDALLKRSDIDGVIVTTPTSMHPQVMIAAAKAGKHIFTEKVIAATLKDTLAITKAVQENGVKLIVSLPRFYWGYVRTISKLLEQGALGKLTQARVRLSHNGAVAGWLPEHFYSPEEAQGGAMIDLGCHPMYLTRLFLGMPERVSATYGYVTGRKVEDNAVVTLGYDNGAIGVVEAGFVNTHSPFTIEVHGTEGTLLYGTPEVKLVLRKKDDKTWQEVSVETDQPKAFWQWVTLIQNKSSQNNTLATENIALATDLSALMEAANLSAKSGQVVEVSKLAVK
jgi:1,5-anhydro-D-fructose reductase (1,5-anhydro-D-mannitol-forming)